MVEHRSPISSADEFGYTSEEELGLTMGNNSTHFSSTEDKLIKEHDLKLRALEALHISKNEADHSRGMPPTSKSSRSASVSSMKRARSIIDLPNPHLTHTYAMPHAVADPLQPKPAEALPSTRSPLSNANALPEQYPSEELIEFFCNVNVCLQLRHKYMECSRQLSEMTNPKNSDAWRVYPPAPAPTYKSRHKYNQIPPLAEEEEVFDMANCEIPGPCDKYDYRLDDSGVYQVFEISTGEKLAVIPTLNEYYSDLAKITRISSDGPSKSFSFKRLQYLEAKWNIYHLLNEFEESTQSKRNPHRDFYNVRKVDTHIHHSACMTQKHLLRFIKYKLRTRPDEQVIFRDGKILSLSEVFKSLNLTAYDLSIDTLDMHAHTDSFHRFDKFNLKYNPIGESRLREIFLKTDNFIDGKYLAELTHQVIDDLEASKYQMTELRISIYGRSLAEWDKLAAWIVDNKLFSHNVRWLVQVPRLYDVYQKSGNVENFQEIVQNLFQPLFEVTANPKSHPKLHVFLQRVIGFDSVDDESKSERLLQSKKFPPAPKWDFPSNPPYSYYIYYLYANMSSLNNMREKLGYNTFVLRPHCGEAGDPEHLISAFLTSDSISHGILLRKIPFVQYLFYLDQIGLAMSPLSNNALFLAYDKNPFYNFFCKGLNVSLSTDDPLQFSYTKEPLIEEYSVAAQIYKLSAVDMCELAQNSVKQSGYEVQIKKHWLGEQYGKPGAQGNDLEQSNVPGLRVNFRDETLQSELDLVELYSKANEKTDQA